MAAHGTPSCACPFHARTYFTSHTHAGKAAPAAASPPYFFLDASVAADADERAVTTAADLPDTGAPPARADAFTDPDPVRAVLASTSSNFSSTMCLSDASSFSAANRAWRSLSRVCGGTP